MAIFAIGIDAVEIDRIQKAIESTGEKFKRRIFTDSEIVYCEKKQSFESYAARFAAKEAVFKATGQGLRDNMKWKDVEVQIDELGKPTLRLSGKLADYFEGCRLFISLTHTKNTAVAVVIAEKTD
ncbi:MAG: holo-[acyl-carrier-protein] synthase [Calditrichia bacterium]